MFTNFTTSVPKDQSWDSNPKGFRQHFFRVNYEVTLFYTSKLRRDRDSNPKAVISDLPIFKIGSSSSRILSKIDTLGQQSTTLPHQFMANGGIRTPGPTLFILCGPTIVSLYVKLRAGFSPLNERLQDKSRRPSCSLSSVLDDRNYKFIFCCTNMSKNVC